MGQAVAENQAAADQVAVVDFLETVQVFECLQDQAVVEQQPMTVRAGKEAPAERRSGGLFN